jgi:hypothetical protein
MNDGEDRCRVDEAVQQAYFFQHGRLLQSREEQELLHGSVSHRRDQPYADRSPEARGGSPGSTSTTRPFTGLSKKNAEQLKSPEMVPDGAVLDDVARHPPRSPV